MERLVDMGGDIVGSWWVYHRQRCGIDHSTAEEGNSV